ncbi:MAG: D-sedoheptulose 7-phosphate isomerase [Magnetococcales bacterium]|nr:D-sedoheptulose 7-phosphate isomerase [Magnetococcales bacterium]
MIDFHRALEEHRQAVNALEGLIPQLEAIARRMGAALVEGRTIFWMGNGGSAADSQHLAAELVGRFTRERRGLPSIALTTDTSILTAVGNDYGYERIFSRQIEALCRPGDVVVGISTSGSSPNVLRALEQAKALGAWTVGFAGKDGGQLREVADACLIIPSAVTARIQEAHILAGHLLCDWVEAFMMDPPRGSTHV